MSTTDKDLLTRWIDRRDAEAFKEIASRHSAMVYATCKRVLGNATDAEDVAQECFEVLVQKGSKAGMHLGAWLHRVATNRSLQRIKIEKRRKKREARYAIEENVSSAEITWDDIYAHVDEAVTNLPEKLRVPIVLRFFEEQTHEAIAQTLGVSRTAVIYRIGKGVEQIRRFLKRRGLIAPTAVLISLMNTHLTAEAAPTILKLVLAKRALAGIGKVAGSGTIPGIAALGGILVMKKVMLIAAVVVAALVGLWAVTHKPKLEPIEIAHETPVAEPRRQLPEVIPQEVTPQDEPAVSEAILEEFLQTETVSTPEGASIEGKLVDSSENPIGSWNVSATRVAGSGKFEGATRAMTGKEGNFLITGLDAGQYRLYAMPSREESGVHFSVRNQQTVIRLGKNEHKKGVILVFDEGLTISGRVLDSEGKPIPHATVYAEPILRVQLTLEKDIMSENAVEKTGADGRFRLMGLMDVNYNVPRLA